VLKKITLEKNLKICAKKSFCLFIIDPKNLIIIKKQGNTMALFNLSSVSDALQSVSDDTKGVSFVGLAKKWETEENGK
jgi:hypothetical protein